MNRLYVLLIVLLIILLILIQYDYYMITYPYTYFPIVDYPYTYFLLQTIHILIPYCITFSISYLIPPVLPSPYHLLPHNCYSLYNLSIINWLILYAIYTPYYTPDQIDPIYNTLDKQQSHYILYVIDAIDKMYVIYAILYICYNNDQIIQMGELEGKMQGVWLVRQMGRLEGKMQGGSTINMLIYQLSNSLYQLSY